MCTHVAVEPASIELTLNMLEESGGDITLSVLEENGVSYAQIPARDVPRQMGKGCLVMGLVSGPGKSPSNKLRIVGMDEISKLRREAEEYAERREQRLAGSYVIV